MNSRTGSGWPSWSLSILLHLALVAIAAGFWFWKRAAPPQEQRLAIEASVVTAVPAARPAPVQAEPEAVPEPVPEPVVEPPPDPQAETQAAEQAEREAEAQRVADAAHVAEERRVADERLATERKAQEEAARRKTEQAARDKAEREKKEKEKIEREKVEREKAEQERKQRELAQAERARTQREAELNAQIANEERLAAARASGQMAQYLSQITARIERAWKRPPNVTPGLQCEVRVTQIPSGQVTAVQVTRCNGDETVRQSIEDAVYRASPLPQPADPALFDRNLTITFRPEN